MNDLVDLWDATFEITYFETRQRMKDIAATALRSVRDATLAESTGFKADGHWPVCFVDDDDWFAPDLAEHLRFPPDGDALVWPQTAVGSPTYPLHRFQVGTSQLLCYTNNYAVSAAYARDHGIDGVLQHWVADTTFRSLRLHAIDEPMSVANKHPASVVWLERNLKGELKPEALKRVVAEFVHGTATTGEETLAGVVWAQPYIELTNRHFERVLASTY